MSCWPSSTLALALAVASITASNTTFFFLSFEFFSSVSLDLMPVRPLFSFFLFLPHAHKQAVRWSLQPSDYLFIQVFRARLVAFSRPLSYGKYAKKKMVECCSRVLQISLLKMTTKSAKVFVSYDNHCNKNKNCWQEIRTEKVNFFARTTRTRRPRRTSQSFGVN